MESSLLGHGSRSYHGNCACQWRSKFFFSSTKDFSVTAQKEREEKEVELSMLILMFLWFLRN